MTPSTSAVGSHTPLDWVGLVVRLVFGGVFFWAGASKLGNLEESVYAVRAYRILPFDVAAVFGYALPIIEVAIGVLLIIGLFTRLSALAGSLLMLAFIGGIASVWIRGFSIDCGCFGGGGDVAKEIALASYPWEIARDVGLLALGVFLVWRPRTPFSADAWLFRPIPDALQDNELDEIAGVS
ncbi:MAG: DoxX family protein [Propionibacteriaceae bacterium]|nr:DoxX family protein [Propionibacteriaceae bacterium]